MLYTGGEVLVAMDKVPREKFIPGTTFTVDCFQTKFLSAATTAHFLSHAHAGADYCCNACAFQMMQNRVYQIPGNKSITCSSNASLKAKQLISYVGRRSLPRLVGALGCGSHFLQRGHWRLSCPHLGYCPVSHQHPANGHSSRRSRYPKMNQHDVSSKPTPLGFCCFFGSVKDQS